MLHRIRASARSRRLPGPLVTRIGITLVLGGSVAYQVQSHQGILSQPVFQLRNDSGKEETQWPRTRAILPERKSQSDLDKQIQSIESKEDDLSSSSGLKKDPSPLFQESPLFDDHDSTAWTTFATRIAVARTSFSSIEWGSIGDSIADYIMPEWARTLPGYFTKLQREMSMAPGSLADDVWREAHDPDINPEIQWGASVRVSNELCDEERSFLERRKKYTTTALARYLEIPEKDIDPADVPTIAMCGSGGGLRALVAGTGSYLSAQEAGLFDCVTYTSGVSGSCWLQTLYHSSLGGRRHDKLVEHLKARIGVHIAFPPTALAALNTAPTNKFLLSGFVEKLKGDSGADFGLVDIYGLLLAARLLVPKGELGVEDRDLKISNQRDYIDRGQNPLPIYTAVRHEIPLKEVQSDDEKSEGKVSQGTKEKAIREAWFQWFEFTPYELWCEELGAGIPSWAIGRKFKNGHNVVGDDGFVVPEFRVPLLMGIWGSAFCATLSHYYKEIRPLVKGLAGFGDIDQLIAERNDELIRLHPIDPGSIPNYAVGMKQQLPPTCPDSIHESSHLQLMDAGMSNNLPIYPLLRPGRDVDILIAFDASADIKTENWLSVADGYARQRNIKGWPIGAGWPKSNSPDDQVADELNAAQAASPQQAAGKIADAREEQRKAQHTGSAEPQNGGKSDEGDLGYCTVWVGTTEERKSTNEPPVSKRLEDHWELMAPDAGIAVIYFPFLPNPEVEGVDPNTSDFMSTWNFVYTPDEIDKVVALARANFEQGKEQTKRAVRAVYERKKKSRIEKEGNEMKRKWRRKFRDDGDHFT
ncbi:MAG: hypothetical protein M1827_001832 [Pycnora praestabilis]|nr:MAG: hypothetical protein M1827_001832 [Pycnora praestabilis]